MSDLTYDEISKSQKVIETNFKIIKDGFLEAEKKIHQRRMEVLGAIQKEQQIESAKLAQIGEALKAYLTEGQL